MKRHRGGTWRLLLLALVTLPRVCSCAAELPLPERIDAAMTAGDFRAAAPLAERLLAELKKQPQKKLEKARAQHVLGSIRDRMGDHAAALKLLEEASAGYESAKASAEELAACADEAGRAALSSGEFATAEGWLRKAVAGRRGSLASISRSTLGEALLKMGRTSEAKQEWDFALTEAGTDAAARCFALRGLGVHAHATAAWEQAVTHFRAARKEAAALGPDAPAMIAALDGQTGQSLLRAGRVKDAAPLLESAAAWFDSHEGSAEERAAVWNNMAALWLANDESAKAAEKLTALLAAPGFAATPQSFTPRLNLAAARQRSGDVAGASAALTALESLTAKQLPAVHPLRVQMAQTGAGIAADAGDAASAERLAQEASRLAIAWLEQTAAWPDESRFLDFHATMDAVSPLAALARQPDSLTEAVLASQGAVTEILLTRRRWERLTAPESVRAWQRDPARTPGPPARRMPSTEELKASLPADALLVNYVRWRPYRGRGLWDESGHYGALLIRRGEPVRWIDLGPASVIETRLRRTITAARDAVAAGHESSERTSLQWQISNLHSLLWAPLGITPATAPRILLRADAMLHFVPWAVLAEAQGTLLCESFPEFQIIVFPRESPASPKPTAWRVLSAGNSPATELPEFTAPLPLLLSPSLLESLRDMAPLPGVAAEAAAIRAAAAQASIRVDAPEASELAFAAAQPSPPGIIHFAGHGFADESGATSLLRAGLVMNDCAASLRDLAAGKPRPASSDGLLFSSDAAALPLSGVSAVVLSGCQTGLGHWHTGGQLSGLRHSFLIAGAGTVVSTLWDLNDATAPEMVRAIYARFATGAPPFAAVWQAQREWLKSPAAAALTPGMRAALAGAWTSESAGWQK